MSCRPLYRAVFLLLTCILPWLVSGCPEKKSTPAVVKFKVAGTDCTSDNIVIKNVSAKVWVTSGQTILGWSAALFCKVDDKEEPLKGATLTITVNGFTIGNNTATTGTDGGVSGTSSSGATEDDLNGKPFELQIQGDDKQPHPVAGGSGTIQKT